MASGEPDAAIACFRNAIEQQPDCFEAYTNLGILLQQRGSLAQAEAAFRLSLAIRPSPETLSNLADLFARSGRFDESETLYRQSLALDPKPATYSNYGALLACLKRDKEAETCFRTSLELAPDNPNTRFNFAYLLLAQGRFSEGWENLEARHPGKINVPELPFPRWEGEALEGKSLLVWPEFGFGDEIQFCRYLPLLKEAGASRIALACREELETLFETLEGADEVWPVKKGLPDEPFDFWTMPLSIPHHLRTGIESIPAEIPYLFAAPERIEKWQGSIPDEGKMHVGLVWKGNPLHENDARRSLSSLSMLSPLWDVENVAFVSLQKGEGENEAKHFFLPLAHLGSEIKDFADSAAILSMLDLVISVDTSIAHLAGAIGKPCWVMLPQFKTDWRWLKDRDDSPWYPTMRLFRQGKDGDWESVILKIRDALQAIPAR